MATSTTPRKRTGTRDALINLRVQRRQRELIDRAASVLGKHRTEFVLDAACREAENVLLDQRMFMLDAAAYRRFVALLNSPPRENEKLRALLLKKAPWD